MLIFPTENLIKHPIFSARYQRYLLVISSCHIHKNTQAHFEFTYLVTFPANGLSSKRCASKEGHFSSKTRVALFYIDDLPYLVFRYLYTNVEELALCFDVCVVSAGDAVLARERGLRDGVGRVVGRTDLT